MKKVLDYGYVRLVESWGSDERIIESARMSTARGFQGWGPVHEDFCVNRDKTGQAHDCICTPKPGDEKLLRYLWEHRHTTPFEMAGATIEVKAPIFVFREWHRHRTQSYSEMSSRYVPLPSEDYLPMHSRLFMSTKSRQSHGAVGAGELTDENARRWIAKLDEHYRQTEELYQLGLRIGVPKELARLPLPVARYSVMRASANLLNWTRFLALRLPEDAQWEIRAYAAEVAEIMSERFPRTSALFGESLLK